MRCTKWNPWWKPEEETPIDVALISLPELPPNFFGKEFVFSLASAVGNPLHIDLATQNRTSPSCAKVKAEVNLLSKFPQRIKIIEEEDEYGPEEFKWIKIKYDYMPKYCKTCKKHNEIDCWVIHPELHKRYDEVVEDQGTGKEVVGTTATSSKEVDNVKGKNKAEALATKNKFDALEVEEIDPPVLQITSGKEYGTVKEKEKQQKLNESNKEKEKKQLENAQKPSPNPK
ncbi:uncharacterized protein [Nicotiana tomentosiformis]|uniref:uncharacterized protein n=1 Tax=Nicotiana tomentosiformis TaxID=4098 RepID=UPI00388CBFFA